MIRINAIGDVCPLPVIKTKKALENIAGNETIEVLVDNEVAVQNVTKFATKSQMDVKSEKISDQEYKVTILVDSSKKQENKNQTEEVLEEVCIPDGRKKQTVVVISSDKMGQGNDELGTVLIKGFIYALTQQDDLPSTVLFYNGGAKLTCENAPTLDDIKSLEAQGVEILTCGTCLNYYGLTDKLKVGEVTNMYVIVEKMTQADKIIKPC